MSKIICFVLCVVAASISNVYAVTPEEKAAAIEALKPIFEQCYSEHGVSKEDVTSAKESGNADGINSCFMGCVMKKMGVMNAEGKLDHEVAVEKLKQYVKNKDDVAKFEQVGKKCFSVNDEPVSDGTAGCERAKLLVTCLLKNRAELPLAL